MTTRFLTVALLTVGCIGSLSVRAEDLARTSDLPPALAALQVDAAQVLSSEEAGRVRGQALGEAGILERMALIEQRALGIDFAATEFSAGAGVVELPNQVFSFNGYLFGEGVLINQNTGSGAIFDGGSLLLLSDLRGDYSVTRSESGIFLLLGTTP